MESKDARAKVLRHAQQMAPAGGRFILFAHDGATKTLWGWAMVTSPLGQHILGERPNSVFACYQNPRAIEVHEKRQK